jgi:hypothetical protein
MPYLNCTLVLAPAVEGLALVADAAFAKTGPHVHHVVVAATGQVAAVGGPLQAAHLLRVALQRVDVVVGHPDVVVVDVS